jgi:glycosyltransferase involved in cell wall biosynthesis
VIVIDDDEELSAASIVAQFPRVRYIAKRGVDRGLSTSRNIGIRLSKGDYLIFLDDDDFFAEHAIDRFASAISKIHNFYYSDFTIIKGKDKYHSSTKSSAESKLMVVNEIPIGAFMIQKSAIRNEFDQALKSHEDWNFLLDNVNWSKATYIPEPLVNIDKSMTDDSSMQVRRRKYFWMEFLGIYAKHPNPDLRIKRSMMIKTLGIDIPPELL